MAAIFNYRNQPGGLTMQENDDRTTLPTTASSTGPTGLPGFSDGFPDRYRESSPMPTGPGRSPSTHNENPPQRGSNRTDWPNNPGYTDTRFPPQPSIQRFRSAGTTEYPYHGFGTESGPAFPQRPAPEPQWDSTVFVDLVANKWRLQSADRKELHEFAKVGRNIPKDYFAVQIYSFTCQLDTRRQHIGLSELVTSTRKVFADIEMRLESTFSLTKEQKKNIRQMAFHIISEPEWKPIMGLGLHVYDRIAKKSESLRFTNVVGNLAREQILMSEVKTICSHVRNAFRESLRDSVLGGKVKTLDEFVYEVGVKYRREPLGNGRTSEGLARLAIFRRFAYENPALLAREEPENVAQSDSDSQTPPPSKKRKLKRGRNAGFEHFWAQVDKWFEEKLKEWGPFSSEPWKQYMDETISLDRERFKNHVEEGIPFTQTSPLPSIMDREGGTPFRDTADGTDMDDILYALE